jgi:hypothetical protein
MYKKGIYQKALLHPSTLHILEDLRFSRQWLWRMASSGMLRHVALLGTDVSEELSTSFIRVTRISELGTMLAVTSNQCMVQRNTYFFAPCIGC